jgi:hypothetical protein
MQLLAFGGSPGSSPYITDAISEEYDGSVLDMVVEV